MDNPQYNVLAPEAGQTLKYSDGNVRPPHIVKHSTTTNTENKELQQIINSMTLNATESCISFSALTVKRHV